MNLGLVLSFSDFVGDMGVSLFGKASILHIMSLVHLMPSHSGHASCIRHAIPQVSRTHLLNAELRDFTYAIFTHVAPWHKVMGKAGTGEARTGKAKTGTAGTGKARTGIGQDGKGWDGKRRDGRGQGGKSRDGREEAGTA